MTDTSYRTRSFRAGLWVLVSLLGARLLAMGVIPLTDTTEARYGEMARRMAQTGDWVTMYQNAQPFMGKPPLFAWLSSISIHFLGPTAFAPRLPSLLLSVLMVWLVWRAAERYGGRGAGLAAALALAGAPFFLATAGTVMTDTALAFSVALIMISFWNALHPPPGGSGKLWGYLFFAGCGLGLLAKGPVALVLSGLPIFFWVLVRKAWRPLWRDLPWMGGLVVTLAIALPWYVLMERAHPGFLKYFIVGENISRFLDSRWQGDRYGFAHAYPYGTIWGFALLGLLPWLLVLARDLVTTRGRERAAAAAPDDDWRLFLVLWCVCPLIFFSFAANIIWPYVLPMIPGFALFFADVERRWAIPVGRAHYAAAVFSGALALAASAAFLIAPERIDHTDKPLITAWRADRPAPRSRLLIWRLPHDFSAEYYARGRAESTQDVKDVTSLFLNDTRDYIVCDEAGLKDLPAAVRGVFEEAAREPARHGPKLLLREKLAPGGSSSIQVQSGEARSGTPVELTAGSGGAGTPQR
ncbi:MAG: glycosyltransferase family 39 protein [Arenicellales bacterium]